jgi:hypothetical protein
MSRLGIHLELISEARLAEEAPATWWCGRSVVLKIFLGML